MGILANAKKKNGTLSAPTLGTGGAANAAKSLGKKNYELENVDQTVPATGGEPPKTYIKKKQGGQSYKDYQLEKAKEQVRKK